jgi:hypothetical protein
LQKCGFEVPEECKMSDRMNHKMSTKIPDKLLKIADEIGANGCANQTRLTVLKKWFERPERLRAFALWMAKLAIANNDKHLGEVGELFQAADELLSDADILDPRLDRTAARELYRRLRAFQDTYKPVAWGAVREIHDWNLLMVEEGLDIVLVVSATPSDGYRLATDYCTHYDPRYGTNLNGPSKAKVEEIARFMFEYEALENERGTP